MFEVGDLIKAEKCYFEQQYGIPEIGIVMDVETRPTIKSEVKGVLVRWLPHRHHGKSGYIPTAGNTWHLANRMVIISRA